MSYLSRDPVEVAELITAVQSARDGAIATFLGVIRDHHDGKSVTELEYTGYEPMAQTVAAAVVAEAESRWPVRVGLRHRLGRLVIGDVAVAVVVAGAHRDEAFAACRFVVDEVKRRVPIWKRERYPDGTEAWVDPTAAGGGHPVGEVQRIW